MVSPYALTRPGGAQGQAMGLARSLRTLGHTVTVFGPAHRGVPVPPQVGEHVVIGRARDIERNGSVVPLALSPLAPVRLRLEVSRRRFDVAHVHEPLAPLTSYGLVVAPPVPMVATYHRDGLDPLVRRLHPVTAYAGRRMRVRVAVSEAARQTGLASGGGEFEVLFNGVELEQYVSASPDKDPEGRPVVVFVGRHEERKGLTYLLDAFALVERATVLWVIGEGPETETLQKRHPESDRVRWLGALSDEDKVSRLAGADVLAAPSLFGESFGVVLLEGMAAGCSVVASDIEGYRGAAGGHAALVPPRNVPALARALDVAVADAAAGSGGAAPAVRQAALAHARTWSMDALAQRYVELYSTAIGPTG
jgi:phosphatidylinositol alpha-mannosyltransferase